MRQTRRDVGTGDTAQRAHAGRLFRTWRPASRWETVAMHGPWFALAAAALLFTWAVPPRRIPLRACTFLALTGYPCPFCGTTRAFHALGHGRWKDALRDHPVSLPLYAVCWAIAGVNGAALVTNRRVERGRWLRPRRRAAWLLAWTAVAALLANWAYRLINGFA